MSGWEAQFARLVAYKAAHGDCSVPIKGWAEDPRLGSIPANSCWVKGAGRDERGAEQNSAKIVPISDFPSPQVRFGSSPDHIGKPC
jgi:hypothetical protein